MTSDSGGSGRDLIPVDRVRDELPFDGAQDTKTHELFFTLVASIAAAAFAAAFANITALAVVVGFVLGTTVGMAYAYRAVHEYLDELDDASGDER